MTGAAGNAAVHFHAYILRVTPSAVVLRRRADGLPHRYRRAAPHTSLPPLPWGPLTLATACQKM